MVSVSGGTLKVYKNAQLQRTLPAIVGGAGTPTPLGVFFVEEVVPLYANAPGEPYALALSARSGVLRSFDGGPGQIAIHSTAYLHSTGESHGCLRVSLANDLWLDRHVPAGTVVAISG
jgi:lipoprotein-anchoring transpeptidase ErfK/SrfK